MDTLKVSGMGRAIRELRARSGISQTQLAASLGWNKSQLSRYENDRVALSLEAIEKIALALGERPEIVVLHCLKHRYPQLSSQGSVVGELLDELVGQVAEHTPATAAE